METKNLKQATFGGGCFWCTEAIFKRVIGVESVKAGYTKPEILKGSDSQTTEDRSYAETIQIEYDPEVIDYRKILEIFFKTHDPTTLNRQDNDVGPQYRSIIFYNNQEQKEIAEALKKELDDNVFFAKPIVTKIEPMGTFTEAESYHQDFYDKNKSYPYCQIITDPKVRKFLRKFEPFVKEEFKEK